MDKCYKFTASFKELKKFFDWNKTFSIEKIERNFPYSKNLSLHKIQDSNFCYVSDGLDSLTVQFPTTLHLHLELMAKVGLGQAKVYTTKTFNKMVDDYTWHVRQGIFKKLPYQHWKDLQNILTYSNKASIIGIIASKNSDIDFLIGERFRLGAKISEAPDDFIRFFIENCDNYETAPMPWDSMKQEKEVEYEIIENKKKEKEKETMNMKMPVMNFEFGPCGDDIALSPYGVAIRNGDQWLTYSPASNKTVDVTGFSFDFKGMLMKVPTAISDVRPGDVVMHQSNPMFVTNVDNNTISAVDIKASEAKIIVPVTNMFGFNYVTKIVSFINVGNMGTPSADQPFGNIMPMLFMSQMLGNDGGLFGDNGDTNMMTQMMQMSFMSQMLTGMGQGAPFGNMFNFGLNGNQENKEG